jgi:hypothetical protein
MKAVRVVLSLALVLVLAAAVQADGKGDKKGKGKKAPGTRGVIEKVEGSTVYLRTGRKKDPDAKTVTITVTDATKYFTRGEDGSEKEAKLSDLAAGKPAVIVSETKDGKEVATKVVVGAGRKKKDKQPPATAG